jgi:cephalosporin-C deacetylase
MAFFDMSSEQLAAYRPPREEPADFDAFWQETLAAARATELHPEFEAVDCGLRTVEAFDVTFRGYGGQPIKAWLMLPRQRSGPLSCVVEYIGYGGGRGFPHEWLVWSAAGHAHLVMDTRGQGSSWSRGDTPDPEMDGGNPHVPGFMTRGVLSRNTYYYRRLYTDAVRAIETARRHPAVDASRVAVTGVSQGGGIALAMSGLVPDVAATMPDVPFLCHFRRATEITDSSPYQEIARFCVVHRDKVEQVFSTLAYFDAVNFAARARCSALFSVGLMDDVCPPSSVFAAYNHFAGPKQMRTWRYNRHEGGGPYQVVEKLRFIEQLWA